MATAPVKIVAVAALMSATVMVSSLVRHRCPHTPSPFLPGGKRLLIMVTNEQQVGGGELDLTDGNVQLLCHGFSEHNYSHSTWSERADIPNGASARLTVPVVHGDEVFEVLCSYRGANRCWAHGVRLLVNPGHDVLFCTEDDGGCEVRFRRDGGVEKQYGTEGGSWRLIETQPPVFMGFVPDFDNARDGECSSGSCVGRMINRVIGEESCCDEACAGWDKATPNKSSGGLESAVTIDRR